MCDPCREKFCAARRTRSAPAIAPAATAPGPGAPRISWRRSPPTARRRAGCAPVVKASWPRWKTSSSPASSRAARARPSSPSERSCWPALRRRARDAGAPLRSVRGRLPQAEGPPCQLRHQRLQAEVELERRRADPGLRQRPLQRAAAPDVREPARPTSARSPTARSAAARRVARRPGSGRAAISSMPASPASRRPRRRTGCARAASGSTRH